MTHAARGCATKLAHVGRAGSSDRKTRPRPGLPIRFAQPCARHVCSLECISQSCPHQPCAAPNTHHSGTIPTLCRTASSEIPLCTCATHYRTSSSEIPLSTCATLHQTHTHTHRVQHAALDQLPRHHGGAGHACREQAHQAVVGADGQLGAAAASAGDLDLQLKEAARRGDVDGCTDRWVDRRGDMDACTGQRAAKRGGGGAWMDAQARGQPGSACA